VDLIIIIIITIKVPTITNISVIIHDRIIKHVDRVGCSMLIVIEWGKLAVTAVNCVICCLQPFPNSDQMVLVEFCEKPSATTPGR